VIRVELVKMLRRPRVWVAIGLLCLLPFIVAVFIASTRIVPPPGQGGVSTSSNTALGVSGFAVAGAGGALLFLGAKKGHSAPSIAVGPKGVSVVKRVAW